MRAVIFDFDGTIADSFDMVIAIAYRLTKKADLSNIEYVKQMKDENVGLREAINRLKIPRWKQIYLLHRGRIIMSKQIHQIPVFQDIESSLKNLKDNNYQLYIISSNSTKNVERFLLEKGLLPYFAKIYGSAGLFSKAKVIKKLLENEALPSDSAVYVGDEVRDILAAKEVNMPCIAVSWGYNSFDLLVQYSPMVIAKSPKQLEKIIIEWGKTI